MDMIFLTGVWGGLVVVLGAAFPEEKGRPITSIKNWLLALGGLILFAYALLNYLFGAGSLFFVFLEGLVIVASVMMMLDTSDRTDLIVLGLTGIGFVGASLMLYEGLNTIYFIAGLTGVALGYALKTGSIQRLFCLTVGSVLIAIFSYLGNDWIFFGLNVFFAIFSAYYLVKIIRK